MDPSRRQALLHAKLGALVTAGWGGGARRREPFPGGAALVDEGAAWLLVNLLPRVPSGPTESWDEEEDSVEPAIYVTSIAWLALGAIDLLG